MPAPLVNDFAFTSLTLTYEKNVFDKFSQTFVSEINLTLFTHFCQYGNRFSSCFCHIELFFHIVFVYFLYIIEIFRTFYVSFLKNRLLSFILKTNELFYRTRGTTMATIKDIANRLGISVSTVSKGLNGASDISESLRQAVLDTAVELGYTTKQMRGKDNKKLCIFVENMDYETPEQFGYDIILGFKQVAFCSHYDVAVTPVTPFIQSTQKYDTYMLKHGYVGAFMIGFALQDDWIGQFNNTMIPTALLDNYIRKNPAVGSIGTDSDEGIDDAIAHLAALGHTRIALINGSRNSMISDQRRQAYIDSMTARNLPFSEATMPYGYYVADAAKDHVGNLLSMGITAILCGNDLIASGVINECSLRGYRVPDDISVIGFDDIPLSAKLNPPLTTIRQNRLELGKSGFYTLHSLINQVPISRTLLRPQLVIRNSTARASF